MVLDKAAGRAYFAAQAVAGAAWWISVFVSDSVREATLGGLDPALVALLDVPLFVLGSAFAALGMRWAVWIVVPWTGIVAAGMGLYATATQQAGWGAVLMIASFAAGIAAGLLVLLGRLPGELLLVGPLAIRAARPGARARHLGATGMQIVVFWGFFLLVLPLVMAWFEDRWRLRLEPPAWAAWAGEAIGALGLSLLIAASALGIWSAVTMASLGEGTPLPSATANRLVIAGPYRFVRNPMALAGISQGVAVGLMLGSWLVVVYALCGSLVWNWAVRPHEEADLEARFGAQFAAYRDRVACWVPRLTGGGRSS